MQAEIPPTDPIAKTPRKQRMAECHPERPNKARGLCKRCYDVQLSRKRGVKPRVRAVARCHPDQDHAGLGLCGPCYRAATKERHLAACAEWRASNKKRISETGKSYYLANKERISQYGKAWIEANADRKRASNAAWRDRNKSRIEIANRAWSKANRDRLRALLRAWRKAHPERYRAQYMNRHALTRNARGRASPEAIAARVAFYGWRCAYCRGPYEHLDHVIPLSRGGTGFPSNLRPACMHCNISKNCRPLSEWKRKATRAIETA